jgi:hypothetical protein
VPRILPCIETFKRSTMKKFVAALLKALASWSA